MFCLRRLLSLLWLAPSFSEAWYGCAVGLWLTVHCQRELVPDFETNQVWVRQTDIGQPIPFIDLDFIPEPGSSFEPPMLLVEKVADRLCSPIIHCWDLH